MKSKSFIILLLLTSLCSYAQKKIPEFECDAKFIPYAVQDSEPSIRKKTEEINKINLSKEDVEIRIWELMKGQVGKTEVLSRLRYSAVTARWTFSTYKWHHDFGKQKTTLDTIHKTLTNSKAKQVIDTLSVNNIITLIPPYLLPLQIFDASHQFRVEIIKEKCRRSYSIDWLVWKETNRNKNSIEFQKFKNAIDYIKSL